MVQRQHNGAIEANLGSLFARVAAYHICQMVRDGKVGVQKVARPLEEFITPVVSIAELWNSQLSSSLPCQTWPSCVETDVCALRRT